MVYGLDPGGLRTHGGLPGDASRGSIQDNTAAERESRTGMMRITLATGGLNAFDSNDLDGAVQRVFDDQRGLLHARLPARLGRARPALTRLHRLSVRVRRAACRGARGAPSPPRTRRKRARPDSFADALFSPSPATEIPIKLTVLFNHDA